VTSGVGLAVVGGRSLAGAEILALLADRDFGGGTSRLLDVADAAGGRIDVDGRELPVEPLRDGAFDGVALAFFAGGPKLAAEYAGMATAAGAAVIDVSTHFRGDDEVPLVVAEVNPDAIAGWRDSGIIACPSSTTVALAGVLAPFHTGVGLRRVVASTYQGAAGAGQGRLEGLARETTNLLNARTLPRPRFARRLAFNVIPQVGGLLEDGASEHEMRVRAELRRVLGIPDLAVQITAVRVPVFHGVGIALAVETETPLAVEEATAMLREAPGLMVHDAPNDPYATPGDAVGSEATHVGRIRADDSSDGGLALWIALDAVRKGIALNAVTVGELLLRDYL
jgi:aspartate-semialdehyde dehydrogenase